MIDFSKLTLNPLPESLLSLKTQNIGLQRKNDVLTFFGAGFGLLALAGFILYYRKKIELIRNLN